MSILAVLALVTGVALAAPVAPVASVAPLTPEAPIRCESCAEWNQPQAPFRVFGNTWYVGVRGLAVVLITSSKGHILLDGALPQSVPLIAKNLETLGFHLADVKLIVNGHAHFDHAGGIAALQKASRAEVAASALGAVALRQGDVAPDDPQAGIGPFRRFAPVAKVRAVADGEVLQVGSLAITAHFTPGHTPGSTTWTWRSCEGEACVDVVYGDSLTPVSTEGYRFSGTANHAGIAEGFARSIARVAALPCDVLLSAHPDFSDTFEKLARRKEGAPNPFIDPGACKAYAADAQERLTKRLAEEAGAK